jgi:2-oxoglutarate ferredoxin oxidoreductase subunit alpha
MKYLWKIGGEAGFGIMTTGLIFSKIASRWGYHIFDYVQYPSLVRGGHNTYDVIFSDEKPASLKWEIDCLVCLNKETFENHQQRLAKEAVVIYDPGDIEEKNLAAVKNKVAVPFGEILTELKGQLIMKNIVALGASLAVLGGDLNELFKILEEQFKKKGQEVIDFNKNFAQKGYDHVKNHYPALIKPILKFQKKEEKLVMTGNDAFSLASVLADCRLYAAYPMTPSSSVLATLASWQKQTGMVVRHAEDEIAVINTALGASFAGVRASVGTSGGGFALMVETISLAGITETPLVIFLAQRPGPATGMPTWTEQGDLLFATFSGHGEFPKIVLAPGDVAEMLELTALSYNLADIYQTPVIVISDMLLSEAHQSLEKKWFTDLAANYKVERGKLVNNSSNLKSQNFLRYQVTEDGISPRLIPGTPGYFYQANSYEHLEDGHTTEDAQERTKQVDKRNKKTLSYLANHFQLPKIYGDFEQAEVVFVSWGSTKTAILEAQNLLKDQGKTSAFIHFSYLYPLDKEKIKKIFKEKKRYILVENNSQGQFGKLLQQETGIEIEEKILKYDGRPFWPEEIVRKI